MKIEARNIYYLFEDDDRYAKGYIYDLDNSKFSSGFISEWNDDDIKYFEEMYDKEMQYIQNNRVWSCDTNQLDDYLLSCDLVEKNSLPLIKDFVTLSIEDEIGNYVVDYDLYIDDKKVEN